MIPKPSLTTHHLAIPSITAHQLAKSHPIEPFRTLTSRLFHEWMAVLMTLNTQRFEIRRMVCTTLTKFKYVMTMGIGVLRLLMAILADAFIAFIDKLFQSNPVIYWRTTIPGVSNIRNFVYFEVISHALPNRIVPRRAATRQTSPCIAAHCHASPVLASPNPTLTTKFSMPHITSTRIARPDITLSGLTIPDPHHKDHS